MILEKTSLGREYQIATLNAHPEIRSLDIAYKEVTKDAEGVIEKIYAHTGMTLSDRSRQAMRDWERDNAQHKLGVHKHELEAFGLTPEMVKERSRNYIARYGAYL